MPTTTYFTDQMLSKSSAAQVREQIQSNVIPNAAAAPAGPTIGQMYLNTTSNQVFVWNGAAWVPLN